MNHPAVPAEITREALWETVASWLGTHGLAIVAIVVAALLSDSNGADPGKDTASATTGS